MSKKFFTEKELKLQLANNYVKSVSSKGITYTYQFKHIFIVEKEKGKFARDILLLFVTSCFLLLIWLNFLNKNY
ncbi:hypothetical protein SAMN05444673_2193 [Bacillus sp. OV166]|nr:hypothetical protein SAMN05444673_2193 [Bacillus sp. OV166]